MLRERICGDAAFLFYIHRKINIDMTLSSIPFEFLAMNNDPYGLNVRERNQEPLDKSGIIYNGTQL